MGGQRAREYLARRGFGDEIIAKFRLGYAPSNNGLKAQLASKGVTEQEMHELGLIAIPEDKTGVLMIFPRPGDDSDYGQAGQGYRFRRAYYGRRPAEIFEFSGNTGV